jgi:hypothetical protein
MEILVDLMNLFDLFASHFINLTFHNSSFAADNVLALQRWSIDADCMNFDLQSVSTDEMN